MRRRRLDGLTRMRLKRDLLDVLAEAATFGPPEVLVDQEFEQIWKNLETSRENGTMDEDDKAKTEDQLRADYRAIADRRVRLGLLLGEIGRVNAIVVTPEEVNMAIRAEASRYPGREAQMIEFYRNYPAATDALRGPIFEDKVIDYVLDSATVTDAEISIEALEQDPDEAKPAGTEGDAEGNDAETGGSSGVGSAIVEAAASEAGAGEAEPPA
jgi:trigger factor